jgi:hypothetical protein
VREESVDLSGEMRVWWESEEERAKLRKTLFRTIVTRRSPAFQRLVALWTGSLAKTHFLVPNANPAFQPLDGPDRSFAFLVSFLGTRKLDRLLDRVTRVHFLVEDSQRPFH